MSEVSKETIDSIEVEWWTGDKDLIVTVTGCSYYGDDKEIYLTKDQCIKLRDTLDRFIGGDQ